MSQSSKSRNTNGALDDSGEASYTSHGKDLNFQRTSKTDAPKDFRRLKKGVTLDRSVDLYDSDNDDDDDDEGQLTIRGDSQNIVKPSVRSQG